MPTFFSADIADGIAFGIEGSIEIQLHDKNRLHSNDLLNVVLGLLESETWEWGQIPANKVSKIQFRDLDFLNAHYPKRGSAFALFIWYQADQLISTLRTIEDHELKQGFVVPAELLIAVLIAHRGITHTNLSSEAVSSMVKIGVNLVRHVKTEGLSGKPMGRSKIEKIVNNRNYLNMKKNLPSMRPLDHARVVLGVSKRVWEDGFFGDSPSRLYLEVDKYLSQKKSKVDFEDWPHIASTLGLCLWLEGQVNWMNTAILFSLPESGDLPPYWHSWLLMKSQNVPRAVVSRLFQDNPILGDIRGFREPDDPGQLSQLVRALLEDADNNARYAPQGYFLCGIPNELPLRSKDGITRLGMVVEAEPRRIWLRAFRGDQGSTIMKWEPDGGVLGNSWLNAVMAAIWRDLRVGGDKGFPSDKKRMASRRHRTAITNDGERKTARRSTTARMSLPRTQAIVLGGSRMWGTDEDREVIRRRRHFVAGHMRILSLGRQRSKEAEERALSYGVLLPEGFTWVSPHDRGGGGERDDSDQYVELSHVRGLSTLIAFSSEIG